MSNCIPFSKYRKIVILANVLALQANTIEAGKRHTGSFLIGTFIHGAEKNPNDFFLFFKSNINCMFIVFTVHRPNR